jgi:hypothetical protein
LRQVGYISRQFEFIQNAWIVSSQFNGLDRESNPLVGNREATPFGQSTNEFSLPQPSGLTNVFAECRNSSRFAVR